MAELKTRKVVEVTFVSQWDYYDEVRTRAKLDWETGEVFYVEVSNEEIEGTCTRQYIVFSDGAELDIDEDAFHEDGDTFVANERVLSVDEKEIGYIVGEDEDSDCGIESCTGTNYVVYWLNGETTICCSKGLQSIDEKTYRIM